ncbi:MAG: UDP-glucose 4-epimerase GalE [Betaproteobacteria bacterium]|nr:MAG: UDP-glucose 4-epimerase GalE [Betaproteobacteria bacterium]
MGGTVLVTGGAGYVGSHVVVALARAGYAPLILDNFANSSRSVLPRLKRLTGMDVPLIVSDVRDRVALARAFSTHAIEAVVHCAGLKAVGEGEAQPLAYYDNNVGGAIALAQAMTAAGVKTLIFSSSATVYGEPDRNPVTEDAPVKPASVYGRTKRAVELILEDIAAADASWRIGLLRYFNPAGADPSGEIGEAPSNAPNNLVPILADVAAGRRACVDVFGDDYATADGTGVRDYIHVTDLAAGHMAALTHLVRQTGVITLNLGMGRGCSVLEVIAAFERACGKPLPRRAARRRPGDIATCYADPARANALLGWRASLDLDAICGDAWRWKAHGERCA